MEYGVGRMGKRESESEQRRQTRMSGDFRERPSPQGCRDTGTYVPAATSWIQWMYVSDTSTGARSMCTGTGARDGDQLKPSGWCVRVRERAGGQVPARTSFQPWHSSRAPESSTTRTDATGWGFRIAFENDYSHALCALWVARQFR